MLVLDERDDLARVCALDEVERNNLHRLQNTPNNLMRLLKSEGRFKRLFGGIDTALRDVLLGQAKVVELLDDLAPSFGGHLAHAGDFECHDLDIVFRHLLHHIAGCRRTNGDKQDGRLLAVIKYGGTSWHNFAHLCLSGPF